MDEFERINDLITENNGKKLEEPGFDVSDVRIIVARNANDGSALVYEPEGFKAKEFGSLIDKFRHAVTPFKGKELAYYTENELTSSCAKYEESDEPGIVTLDEYKAAFKDIEVAMYTKMGLPIGEMAVYMSKSIEDIGEKVVELKQQIDVQQDQLKSIAGMLGMEDTSPQMDVVPVPGMGIK